MELDFELARARSAPIALFEVEVERLARFDPAARARVLLAIGARLAELAPPGGLVAATQDARIVVLVRDAGFELAETLARSWIAAARKLTVAGEPGLVRASLSIGVAATRAGLDPYFETLVAVAREGLDVARSNGGECCVHSELYEFHQRRIERKRGPRAPVPAPVKPEPRESARNGTVDLPAPRPETTKAPAMLAVQANAKPPEAAAYSPALPLIPGLDLAAIEARVLELTKAAFQRELDEREKRFRSELELYERRIAKMQRALAETEGEKEQLARAKGLDTGVASVYRDVQGLVGDERDFAQRDGLLRAIAESNLSLKNDLKRRPA